MPHPNLFVFFAHAEGDGGGVFDDEFAKLEAGYGLLYFVEFLAWYAEEVSDDAVVDGLLLHDQRVLGVGIEIEMFAFEAVHVLGGKDDAESFVSSYGNEVMANGSTEMSRSRFR